MDATITYNEDKSSYFIECAECDWKKDWPERVAIKTVWQDVGIHLMQCHSLKLREMECVGNLCRRTEDGTLVEYSH